MSGQEGPTWNYWTSGADLGFISETIRAVEATAALDRSCVPPHSFHAYVTLPADLAWALIWKIDDVRLGRLTLTGFRRWAIRAMGQDRWYAHWPETARLLARALEKNDEETKA